MSPFARPVRLLALAVLLALAAGCAEGGEASFDPSGPCVADGSAQGAYPELEARVPVRYEGRGPDLLDSGRNCTDENLGSLAGRGIDEVRFAGGTWEFGNDIALVLAVFSAEDLTVDGMAEWWRTTAEASARTEVIGMGAVDIAGVDATRLDTRTGERIQSVVVWQGDEPGIVHVVITHNLPDPKIEAAVAAFEAP